MPAVNGTSVLNAHDFAVLGRVALLTGTSRFPDGIDNALDALRLGAKADEAELFLLDPHGGELLMSACVGLDVDAFCSRERFELGVGFPGIVARRGSHLVSRDLVVDPRFLRADVRSLGYRSMACVPVKRGERVLGTLSLVWKRRDAPLEKGVKLLRAVAPTISTALTAAFATHVLKMQAADRSLERVAETFRVAGHGDAATIVLLNQDSGEVTACASTGSEHMVCNRLASGGREGCPGELPGHRCQVLHGSRSEWNASCRTLPKGFAQIIEVPLEVDGRCVGVVTVGYREPLTIPTTQPIGPLVTMAEELGPRLVSGQRLLMPAMASDAAPAARLQLQCFGPLTVFVEGCLVPRRAFARAKSVELLKALILARGRPLSRDHLIETLWPGAQLSAGRSRLHVALHALRRVIEPVAKGHQWQHICSVHEGLHLDLVSDCSVDVEDFRSLIRRSHRAATQGEGVDQVIGLLDRAVDLYRGDLFLDADQDWYEAERRRLRDEFLEAVLRLADLSSRHGSPERALALLRHATEIEPLREDVLCRLVRGQWRAGQRRAARERYDGYVRRLREQVGVGPSSEVRRLGEALGR